MTQDIGIWIDHKTAVIVFIADDQVTTATLKSDLPGHPHFGGSQEGGGEKKYEERHDQELDRFYDEVIGRLGTPRSLLLFGPGEARQQLKERLGHSKALSGIAVAVESADKLTEPQIVARVKEHFGIAR